jgi:intraflagellar transport protein 122
MERYIEKNDYESAYLVASLGVCDGDWKRLGVSALERLNLDIAIKCFTRIQDFNALEGVRTIEKIKAQNKEPDLALAHIHSFLGNYHDVRDLTRQLDFSSDADTYRKHLICTRS